MRSLLKIFNSFLVIALFGLQPALALAQTPVATLSLSPSSTSVGRGCNLAVDINLNTGGANTDGTDVIIKFDRTKFTAVSITPGIIYPDYPASSPDNSTGTISISGLAAVDKPFNGTGKFATINFTANPGATAGLTQVTFDFDPNNKQKTTDTNVVQTGTVQDILNSVQNGTYTVTTGSCAGGGVPTPIPVAGAGAAGFGSGATGFGGTDFASDSGSLPNSLANTGDVSPTTILAIVGVILTFVGVVGLALL